MHVAVTDAVSRSRLNKILVCQPLCLPGQNLSDRTLFQRKIRRGKCFGHWLALQPFDTQPIAAGSVRPCSVTKLPAEFVLSAVLTICPECNTTASSVTWPGIHRLPAFQYPLYRTIHHSPETDSHRPLPRLDLRALWVQPRAFCHALLGPRSSVRSALLA